MNKDIPSIHTRDQILTILKTISIDNSQPGELANYVGQDLDRFLITYNLVAEAKSKKLLEIGANPYFLTILLKWFQPKIGLTLINFFGSGTGQSSQLVELDKRLCNDHKLQSTFKMPFFSVNCEDDDLPFASGAFDTVVFCEVLEHFTTDPFRALKEIARVLKIGGHIVLSTPNIARLENVARLIYGTNLYDPYSGHGVHGRHNREYTRHEVSWLLRDIGFEPISHFTADVYPNTHTVDYEKLPLPKNREHDFGQYQFHLWHKARENKNSLRPSWLYRNMIEPLNTSPL